MEDCISKIKKGGADVCIAALGVQSNSETLLFDLAGDRSTLIDTAKENNVPLLVFSQTACRVADYGRAW